MFWPIQMISEIISFQKTRWCLLNTPNTKHPVMTKIVDWVIKHQIKQNNKGQLYYKDINGEI